jgi:hypothetical protein
MKEVIAANANFVFAPNQDGGLTPMIELIIITSEPQWDIGGESGNKLIRSRKTEHTRQMLGLPQAYQLANQIRDIAADAEAESNQINDWIAPHLIKEAPATGKDANEAH